MPTTYEKAQYEVTDLAAEIMQQYHGDLLEAGVSVSYMMAANADAPAVTLNGYPCAAKVKVIGLLERADGRADAEVLIDAGQWADASDANHRALIDHELTHLELKRDDRNFVKRDDLGRPLLKLRKHDHQFGWFDTIAHRHGDASYEVQQAKAFADEHGQTYFGWGTPPERAVESAAPERPAANVTTGDGRKITVDQMMGELGAKFGGKAQPAGVH